MEKSCGKNALTVCIAKTKEEMQFEHHCIHGLYFSRGADSSLLASLQQLDMQKSQAKTLQQPLFLSMLDSVCIQKTHVTCVTVTGTVPSESEGPGFAC